MCSSACRKRSSSCEGWGDAQRILAGRTTTADCCSPNPSLGVIRLRRPRNGPPSKTGQYCEIAATAAFRRCHSASKDVEVGYVNSFSRRNICSGSIWSSVRRTSLASSSSTAIPESWRSMSLVACFRSNSIRVLFRSILSSR